MLAGNRCYAVLQDPNGYVMFAVHYGGALPTNPQMFTPGCIMIKPDVPTGRVLVNTGTLAVPSWGAVSGTLGGLVADPSQVPPPPPPEMVAAMREKSAADHKLPTPPPTLMPETADVKAPEVKKDDKKK
jgi:hypothetical protein